MTEKTTNLEACPGCGCLPGDGYTPGCDDPDGCGYFAAVERSGAEQESDLRASYRRLQAVPTAVGEMFDLSELAILARANRADYATNLGEVVIVDDARACRYVVALRMSDACDEAQVVASFDYAYSGKVAYTRALDALRREALR